MEKEKYLLLKGRLIGMSEERIKERCKREDITLKIVKGFIKKDCDEETELYYSLLTLLDLYNKQKQINQEHQKLNGELQVKINKLEEENSMLKGMFKKSIKE